MCELLRAEIASKVQWKRRKTLLSCLTFTLRTDRGFHVQKALLRFINGGYKSYGVVRLANKRKFSVRYLANAGDETVVRNTLESMDPEQLVSLQFGFLLIGDSTVFVWTAPNGRDLIEATLSESIRTLRQNGWPVRATVGRIEDLFEVETTMDHYDLIRN